MIDTHLVPKLIKRGGYHRAVCVRRSARVVEHDIKLPEAGDSLPDRFLNRFRLSYVTRLEYRIAACSDYVAGYFFAFGDSATRQHDASPLLSEHLGASLADSTRCSHYKSAFVF